ncbi:MAG: 3-isopropylmalate dehydratase small subunit [Candidatus Accumulibacter sp.]|jgi:3-isopropylmalate/(R)-2-methylmalate dehydratase small subunit|nr:3-isopropylmalate dehydratase small subunit [Accumulibacter sp.]
MTPFQSIDTAAVPIVQPNFDTDQIIPSRYLQKLRENDFGVYLFRDLRFREDGSENPDFVVNQPAYRQGRAIVAGRNFACGSSREHAVWALCDYGFRAVIAPSFGDIFFSNALKNGLLPIVLPERAVADLLAAIEAAPGSRIRIDLVTQTVTAPGGTAYTFFIDPFSKHCLLNGIDEIDYTLGYLDRIEEFEERHGKLPSACPRQPCSLSMTQSSENRK